MKFSGKDYLRPNLEQDVTFIEQKHYRRKRVIGITYLCLGVLITGFMLLITIWPGLLAYFLFPDMNWVEGEGTAIFFLNILLAIGYFLLAIALVFLIGTAPLLALPIVVLIGIPSITGGIGLLKNKKWAMKLLVIISFFYLLIFPLGTLLSVFTFRLNSKEKNRMLR